MPAVSAPQAIRTYLNAVSALRRSGQAQQEVSFYPALHRLLEELGLGLSPQRTAVTHPALGNAAGMPDNALYDKKTGALAIPVEVKPASATVASIIRRKQVLGYAKAYGGGRVLVSNLRHFALAEVNSAGTALQQVGEAIELVQAEADLNHVHPTPLAPAVAGFPAFLTGATAVHGTIADPQVVAALLAYHARQMVGRILATSNYRELLAQVEQTLQDGLGMHLSDEFFVPTLVQTLVYGIFSGWLDHVGPTPYNWRAAYINLRPLAAADLFGQVRTPAFAAACRLDDMLDVIGGVLDWVDKPAFTQQFAGGAIEYFYEPFLAEFDPRLRERLGVWYTPKEIADYMVARADHHVRTDLGKPDGLADPSVVILDPACGTGTYLRAVLDQIWQFHKNNGNPDSICAAYAKQAALTRVIGFEVLPAALVITHLNLARWLAEHKARLAGNEKLKAYLTNALLEWGVAATPPVPLPGVQQDLTAAHQVKLHTPVLVVLGNPPYEGFSMAENPEERELLETWTAPLNKVWGVRKHRLGDLYVRFWRIAVRRIAELTGQGVVTFISNGKWLAGRSFPEMRRDIVGKFDEVVVDDLHGSVNDQAAGDESIFKTRIAPGIRIGVAIVTAVRRTQHPANNTPANTTAVPVPATVRVRDLTGAAATKRHQLDGFRGAAMDGGLQPVQTSATLRWRLVNRDEADAPSLDEYFRHAWSGVQATRAEETVLSDDQSTLTTRMQAFFDPSIPDAVLEARYPAFERLQAVRRRRLAAHAQFDSQSIVRFLYRPLDVRWLYWERQPGLIHRPRPDLAPHMLGVDDQRFIVTTQTRRRPGGARATFASAVPGWHCADPDARALPRVVSTIGQQMFGAQSGLESNIEAAWILAARAAGVPGADLEIGDEIFYALAGVMNSTAWLDSQTQESDEYPYVPIPKDPTSLQQAAELGRQVSALHDPDTPVPGVTTGQIEAQLTSVAVPNLQSGDVLVLGHKGESGGVWDAANGGSIRANDTGGWGGVPQEVWGYSAVGYPLLRKFLAYRVGQPLSLTEITQVAEFCRRIAKLIDLQADADRLYAVSDAAPLAV